MVPGTKRDRRQMLSTTSSDDDAATVVLSDRTTMAAQESPTIYYFGYGPIVNPAVRKRRGVSTCCEQAAILPEYRLTFAYGGVVNAIRQRGYEVYGVLLGFTNQADWEKFQEFDAGYDLEEVLVYPCSEEGEDEEEPVKDPIKAYTFVYDREYTDGKKEETFEKLPQERYLKLIANGLRFHGINEDYIEDQIMNVPYVPKTKPQNYKVFAQPRKALPKMTLTSYQQRLCQNAAAGTIYFIIGNKVVHVDSRVNPSNPCSVWLQERAHGLDDSTFIIHQTVVDPDIPCVDDPKDITSLHVAWAEHHLVEYLERGGLTGVATYELISPTPYRRPTFAKVLNSLFGQCGRSSSNRADNGEEGDLLGTSRRSNRSLASGTSRPGSHAGSRKFLGFGSSRNIISSTSSRSMRSRYSVSGAFSVTSSALTESSSLSMAMQSPSRELRRSILKAIPHSYDNMEMEE